MGRRHPSFAQRPARRVVGWAAPALLLLAGAGIGAAGAASWSTLVATPSGAQPIGDCSTTDGVIVVVDFAHWGGTIERGCAPTPTDGYDALRTAGFSTAGDEHDGPAFICRIDTEPDPTQTACVDTPPASAYWSNWHAPAGQTTWSYATTGAMTYKPPPGGVTAWVFGPTSTRPPFTPTQVRATNAGPGAGTTTVPSAPPTTAPPAAATTLVAPATTTTTATGGGAPGAGGGPATTTPTPPAGPTGTTTTAPAAPAATTTTTRARGSTSPTDRPTTAGPQARRGGAPRIVDVAPGTAQRTSSPGSPTALVVGGLAALALLATATVIGWRRRAATAGPPGHGSEGGGV